MSDRSDLSFPDDDDDHQVDQDHYDEDLQVQYHNEDDDSSSGTSARKLHDVIEAFRSSIGEQFLKLFDLIASSLNMSEDHLIFFAE